MSKKARRERTPNLPPEAFNAPTAASVPAPASAKASTIAATPAKAPTAGVVNWQQEYGEVLGDLRRTFIIFTAIVVTMIALSFVIR